MYPDTLQKKRGGGQSRDLYFNVSISGLSQLLVFSRIEPESDVPLQGFSMVRPLKCRVVAMRKALL